MQLRRTLIYVEAAAPQEIVAATRTLTLPSFPVASRTLPIPCLPPDVQLSWPPESASSPLQLLQSTTLFEAPASMVREVWEAASALSPEESDAETCSMGSQLRH
jgi:hypothetical protein